MTVSVEVAEQDLFEVVGRYAGLAVESVAVEVNQQVDVQKEFFVEFFFG